MKSYLSLVKFSHTIFALPFALLGFAIATLTVGQGINWRLLGLVVLCMIFARSAAMAFNRYIDRDIDALNARTAGREIPAGIISPRSALLFVIVNALLFVITTWWINPICFYLSPVALLIILGYSYTKRFTALCHLVLGLGLSLAPVGAYLAVTGAFHVLPVCYGLAVLFWVSGFDIIYAMQDKSFDEAQSLHSMPTWLGLERALRLSSVLHILCGTLILYAGYLLSSAFVEVNWLHWLGAVIFVGLLLYQHRLVSPGDLRRVNLAFFTTNGVASMLLCGLIILDILVG